MTTVILPRPTAATKESGTAAVNCLAETKVVVSAVPFHSTTEVETKPVPLSVRVTLVDPGCTLTGDKIST